jgi:hypothetical protein
MTVPHYRLAVVQAGTSYGKSTAWAAFAAEVPGIICAPIIWQSSAQLDPARQDFLA